ncbi:AraC family transcriptional regulator [Butyricimonas muris]|uniref:AraC family transcriptional regulator n=1 Tax=Butyricimonas muris TaxID=3378067 RepID=UPI003966D3D9
MQSFRMIKPAPGLARYVRHYWILEEDAVLPVSERVLPVGCVQLVFHKGESLFLLKEGKLQPRAMICGHTFGFSDVLSTGRIEMLTVVFQPYAAKAFLHIPVRLFHGQSVAMEDVEDKDFKLLTTRVTDTTDQDECIRLIERFLIRRLYTFPEYNLKRVVAALHEINVCPSVDIPRLADVACLGDKQFRRVFMDYMGTTPKEFIRIVRMQRALFMLQQDGATPFAQVAYACGFSDQSHMIKEFKLFSGYTPAEYLTICAPYSDYFSHM